MRRDCISRRNSGCRGRAPGVYRVAPKVMPALFSQLSALLLKAANQARFIFIIIVILFAHKIQIHIHLTIHEQDKQSYRALTVALIQVIN